MNELALAIFAVVLAVTLGVTYWASKRTSTATEFWAAGRGISAPQNGLAIAGDYMSAASFLGIAGLIFMFGFDGFLYSVGFLVAWLVALLLGRARKAGDTAADLDPDHEAAVLLGLLEGLSGQTLVGHHTVDAALAVVDGHLDRLFTSEGSSGTPRS